MTRSERRGTRAGTVVAIVLGLVAIAAIALALVRPARVTGISQNALETSVSKTLGSRLPAACDKVRADRWSCVAAEDGGLRAGYSLTIDGWGCWEATRAGGAEGTSESCISVGDFVDIDTDG